MHCEGQGGTNKRLQYWVILVGGRVAHDIKASVLKVDTLLIGLLSSRVSLIGMSILHFRLLMNASLATVITLAIVVARL